MSWNPDPEAPPFLHDHPLLGGFVRFGYAFATKPAFWFRKNIIEPYRAEPENYYHRQFRRVPQIDECYKDDIPCRFEAQEQFMRDQQVEGQIVSLLRNRFEDCMFYNKGTGMVAWQPATAKDHIDIGEGSDHQCRKIYETFMTATENYFIKYGELGKIPKVQDAYMKQKHRLMWERRHGPIGSGMKQETEAAAPQPQE